MLLTRSAPTHRRSINRAQKLLHLPLKASACDGTKHAALLVTHSQAKLPREAERTAGIRSGLGGTISATVCLPDSHETQLAGGGLTNATSGLHGSTSVGHRGSPSNPLQTSSSAGPGAGVAGVGPSSAGPGAGEFGVSPSSAGPGAGVAGGSSSSSSAGPRIGEAEVGPSSARRLPGEDGSGQHHVQHPSLQGCGRSELRHSKRGGPAWQIAMTASSRNLPQCPMDCTGKYRK